LAHRLVQDAERCLGFYRGFAAPHFGELHGFFPDGLPGRLYRIRSVFVACRRLADGLRIETLDEVHDLGDVAILGIRTKNTACVLDDVLLAFGVTHPDQAPRLAMFVTR